MLAGREMDALVAEKVMGCTWEEWETGKALYAPDGKKLAKRLKIDGMALTICDINGSECVPTRPLPRFSEDIATAWEVVAKLARPLKVVWTGRVWVCEVFGEPCSQEADTAPLAICRAALKVMIDHERRSG